MKSQPYPQLAARVLNRPLLMGPERLQPLLSVLGPRLGFDSVWIDGARLPLAAPAFAFDLDADDPGAAEPAMEKLYPVVDGVAEIRIEGTLVNRGAWIGSYCGMTSYEGLRAQLTAAYHDPDVRAILLDIDCGGGEAAGCAELAELIEAIAGEMPVWACLADEALSAAYWLASAAGNVYLPRLGEAGSIGVWCLHMDMSARLKGEGLSPTLIHAGKHKVDGHPFAPLGENVQADWQASVDETRAVFADAVARYRDLSVADVLKTEARILRGPAAVSAGLVDGIKDRFRAQWELSASLSAARGG
jgi:ClpP class serine protease